MSLLIKNRRVCSFWPKIIVDIIVAQEEEVISLLIKNQRWYHCYTTAGQVIKKSVQLKEIIPVLLGSYLDRKAKLYVPFEGSPSWSMMRGSLLMGELLIGSCRTIVPHFVSTSNLHSFNMKVILWHFFPSSYVQYKVQYSSSCYCTGRVVPGTVL
jgi:hypothetical protein